MILIDELVFLWRRDYATLSWLAEHMFDTQFWENEKQMNDSLWRKILFTKVRAYELVAGKPTFCETYLYSI